MARNRNAYRGFLARLMHNQAGNVLAMTAAAVFPLAGMIGGAVDMARIYAVRARLQAACDAGALAGRRVMGTGQWTDNGGLPNTSAQNAFDLNFESGAFGSQNRTRNFVESNGTVTGTASADVPMTLMRIFNMPVKTIAVTCDGMMRIPNTDIMFVLDNSGSMAWAIPGDASGMTKIEGLHTAVKCFYEALAKLDIDDITPSECGTTANPSGGVSSQVQLRFGFVNYDHMVNVGKLLPNDYLVDSWTYQSREPIYSNVDAWTAGTESAVTWGSWSSAPSNLTTDTSYSGWGNISGGGSVTINGTSWPKTYAGKTSTTCPQLNTLGTNMLAYTDSGSIQSASLQSATTPVYPASTQTLTYGQDDDHTATGYRYKWSTSGSGSCRLQKSNSRSYTLTRSGTSTKPLTWTSHTTISAWAYKPVSFNVSGLKAGGSSWNNSVSLPISQTNGSSVTQSGSTSSTTLKVVANSTVDWDGCIEERKTFLNTDGNPSDDWTNYPTSPTDAIDMDIDRVPSTSDDNTRWRPVLHGAVWGRRDTLSSGGSWSGSYTTNATTGGYSSSTSRNLNFNNCVTASRKLQIYNTTTLATNFRDYVNTLAPNGNTYHDIGLLWGARLMSPTGIFASENANTPGGASIQRHMIFMTDGDTANSWNNYASYGLEWWDRRQVTPAGSTSTNLTNFETALQDNNNARSNALCTAIKNKGITLWVISYGDAVNTTTINRLTACASSPSYFFSAANTTQLITKFREIADKISQLRLTN